MNNAIINIPDGCPQGNIEKGWSPDDEPCKSCLFDATPPEGVPDCLIFRCDFNAYARVIDDNVLDKLIDIYVKGDWK